MITDAQLARLYHGANKANSNYAVALREKAPKPVLESLKRTAAELNSAYDAARRQYKRQQKAERQALTRTQMIRWYLDQQEAA
jgi:hypothetical protein